jgi:hypothetical protein
MLEKTVVVRVEYVCGDKRVDEVEVDGAGEE